MAKKKTQSKQSWRLSTVLWMLLTSLSSGSIGAYFNRDIPLLGSLLEYLQSEVDPNAVALPGEAFPGTALPGAGGLGAQTPAAGGASPPVGSMVSTQLASAQHPPIDYCWRPLTSKSSVKASWASRM